PALPRTSWHATSQLGRLARNSWSPQIKRLRQRWVDTPPGSQPGDSSGYAHPSGPRWRLRGLPGPTLLLPQRQDIQGGIVVPMQLRAALRAGVPANREGLLDKHPAARTDLAGVGRWHGYGSLPSVCCFEGEDAQEHGPPGIRNGLRQMVILE